MLLKDTILNEFLKHDSITSDSKITFDKLPIKVESAKLHDHVLIALIALIVEQVDKGMINPAYIDNILMKKINSEIGDL